MAELDTSATTTSRRASVRTVDLASSLYDSWLHHAIDTHQVDGFTVTVTAELPWILSASSVSPRWVAQTLDFVPMSRRGWRDNPSFVPGPASVLQDRGVGLRVDPHHVVLGPFGLSNIKPILECTLGLAVMLTSFQTARLSRERTRIASARRSLSELVGKSVDSPIHVERVLTELDALERAASSVGIRLEPRNSSIDVPRMLSRVVTPPEAISVLARPATAPVRISRPVLTKILEASELIRDRQSEVPALPLDYRADDLSEAACPCGSGAPFSGCHLPTLP